MNTDTLAFRTFRAILAVATIAISMLLGGEMQAAADRVAWCDPGYPDWVDVQVGAPVFLTQRTEFPEGFVAHGPTPSFPCDGVIAMGNKVHVPVYCWQDGEWFDGNYRSNRWFQVKVTVVDGPTFDDGYTGPFMVHSSYVTNQVPVRNCGYDGI